MFRGCTCTRVAHATPLLAALGEPASTRVSPACPHPARLCSIPPWDDRCDKPGATVMTTGDDWYNPVRGPRCRQLRPQARPECTGRHVGFAASHGGALGAAGAAGAPPRRRCWCCAECRVHPDAAQLQGQRARFCVLQQAANWAPHRRTLGPCSASALQVYIERPLVPVAAPSAAPGPSAAPVAAPVAAPTAGPDAAPSPVDAPSPAAAPEGIAPAPAPAANGAAGTATSAAVAGLAGLAAFVLMI